MILEWFIFAFNAIAPIIGLIGLGYILRQKNFFSASFPKEANKFAFHYCIGTMQFLNIYNLDSIHDIPVAITIFVVIALSLLSALGLIMGHICTDKHERIGVIAQTWMRSNSAVIGIPLATAIGGSAAAAVLTPLQAPAVIMYNSMSVIFLSIYNRNAESKIDGGRIVRSVFKNPLVKGLLLGILALAIREVLPVNELGHPVVSLRYNLPFLYDILDSLSKVATPLALVALGGQFSFGAVKSLRREIITTTLGRLVAAPAIGFTLAYTASRMGFFAWDPALVAAFIAVFASPVSVSSAPMASEMNADDVLAGQLVVWTSLMGTVSLFVLIVLFQAISWL